MIDQHKQTIKVIEINFHHLFQTFYDITIVHEALLHECLCEIGEPCLATHAK